MRELGLVEMLLPALLELGTELLELGAVVLVVRLAAHGAQCLKEGMPVEHWPVRRLVWNGPMMPHAPARTSALAYARRTSALAYAQRAEAQVLP